MKKDSQVSLRVSFPFALLISALLAGCASAPTGHYYGKDESLLRSRGGLVGDAGVFHDVLYQPEAIALTFPGYIVGLEKSSRDVISRDAAGVLQNLEDEFVAPSQQGVADAVARMSGQSKTHFISHVVKNFGTPFADGNCYLYSVYSARPDANEGYVPTRPIEGCKGLATKESSPAQAFFGSREAVDLLVDAIRADVAGGNRYTHVVFVVMGWNTAQIEAVRNFNSIVTNIRRAAHKEKAPFNPLFVGVTWASQWDSDWLQPMVTALGYTNKANDADEIGVSWLGDVVDRVSAATPGLPKVAIGHSFGARALSMAICMGPQFKGAMRGEGGRAVAPIDLFVGLQPAVSINRFLRDESREAIQYPNSCSAAKRVVLTASRGDKAVTTAFWAEMAGADDERREVCEENPGRFGRSQICVSAKGDGRTQPAANEIPAEFVYVDASRLVSFEQPNTSGKAHSDIYRQETGRFIWQWFPNEKRR